MTTLEDLEARIIALEIEQIKFKRRNKMLCFNEGCENQPSSVIVCSRCYEQPLGYSPRTELEYHAMIHEHQLS